VISKAESKNGQARWHCKCKCGNTTVSYAPALRTGTSTSCGCFRKERVAAAKTKHGHARNKARDATYRSWESMRRRINSELYKGHAHYGGRGIVIDPRWDDYENFLRDMGPRPEGTSIDRIDVNGNYERANCRWADATTQRHNRQDSAKI